MNETDEKYSKRIIKDTELICPECNHKLRYNIKEKYYYCNNMECKTNIPTD